MGWNTNPVGIVIDRSMNADFAALKAAGFCFVVIDAGLGFDVGSTPAASPALAEQIQKAANAGLPVIASWTPFPAYDDYTFDQTGPAQIVYAQKALANKTYHAFVVSVERYWTGLDIENGHEVRVATPTAINQVASDFVHTFTKQLAPLNHPVLIRTNDAFVQKYCQPMAQGWTDAFGFYLADWRYRTRAADGSYSVYTSYKTERTPISTMVQLRAEMPPDGAKNPLVPGNTPQLKFWEYSGNRYVLPWVKGWDGSDKTVKVVLFNGNEEAMKAYLGVNVAPPPVDGTPVPHPPTDPVDPPADPGQPPVDQGNVSKMEASLSRIVVLCEQMAGDLHAIRQVFRE